MENIIYLVPASGVLALLMAVVLFFRVKAQPPGNARMQEIGGYIAEGAMAFLKREYTILAIYALVVFAAISAGPMLGATSLGLMTGITFLVGAGLSLLAGYLGMKAATMANIRTAQAAVDKGRGDALMVAFDGGAVMGLCVAGLGTIGLGGLYIVFKDSGDGHQLAQAMHGFGVGASSIALFARIGGGIYTKAADVGADLAGKVIAGIPEDDPRNPGVIADNVGDNVGDVAGMGADIYESLAAAIIAAVAIGIAAPIDQIRAAVSATVTDDMAIRDVATIAPLLLSSVGLIISMMFIFGLRFFKSASPATALRAALLVPPVLFIGVTAAIVGALDMTHAITITVALGAIGGGAIGMLTDYYTSAGPVMRIARSSETGAGTNVITGLSVGLESVVLPLLILAVIVFVANGQIGLYGVAIAAVAMLSVTAIVMTVDAYGPISDNAGGIAEMAELGENIRKITDELDAVGNTTAAIGKGFAIGSAVLTVLALFAAFNMEIQAIHGVNALNLDITNPIVMVGMLLGGTLPCIVGFTTMKSVGIAAGKIVVEIKRQFDEIPGLLEGREGVRPDAAKIVDLSTQAALGEMVLPGMVAVLAPVVIGFGLGAEALAGALASSMITGAVMSLFMANAGGAWDNAKKFIEAGRLEGHRKGSDAHKAAVVGDTVGDPFKDTSGPGIAILIKVMSVVSLLIATSLPI